MTDLAKTILPKSDQLNADDLIGGVTKTIKVTGVNLIAGDQPIAIHYEGDNGKPYKPGKSMRRVLVNCWGPDGNVYIGRSMTLYRDDKVVFGGVPVGGIRISHLSHIDKEMNMALTVTRTSRKPFVVKPLVMTPTATKSNVGELKTKLTDYANQGTTALATYWTKLTPALQKTAESYKAELNTIATEADAKPKDGMDW